MNSRLDELFEGLPMRLDVHDVARLLGVSTKGVYAWINQGVVPAYKIGASWLILRDELKDTLLQGSNLAHRLNPPAPGQEEPPSEAEGDGD